MSERTEWEPSEAQRKLLTVLQSSDYELSISEACTAADVGRQTYYDWFDSPAFVQWWKAQAERHFVLRLPRVLANLAGGAVKEFEGGKNPDPKPDAGLIKIFLERFDRDYSPKHEIDQHIDGQIAVNHSAMIAAALNGGFQRTNRIAGQMGGVN